jgi:hypothetical protein
VDLGSSVSSLIAAAERGDQAAAEALFCTLYKELHRLAKRELARYAAPVTLGVTTLWHEAYLEISANQGSMSTLSHDRWQEISPYLDQVLSVPDRRVRCRLATHANLSNHG